jgi:hypothetical protein
MPNAYLGFQETSTSGSGKGDLVFGTRNVTTDTAPLEHMRISAAGYVGIGTTNPGSALDVSGAIRMDGSTSGYAGFKAQAAAGSTVWALPASDGTSGQVLATTGTGTLQWATAGAGGGGTVTSVAAGGGLAGGPITASGTLSLGTAGIVALGTYGGAAIAAIPYFATDAYGRIASAGTMAVAAGTGATVTASGGTLTIGVSGSALTGLNASLISSGTLAVAEGGLGMTTAIGNGYLLAGNGMGGYTGLGCAAGQTLGWTVASGFVCTTMTGGTGISVNTATAGIVTVSLGTSGVAAGTVGSPTYVPTIGVDQYGRVVSLGSVAATSSGSTQWATNGGNLSYSGGNVGIGTATPASMLDVNGSVRVAFDGAGCSPSNTGAIRLNGGSIEFCSGTAWTILTAGSQAGTLSNVASITGLGALSISAGGTNQNLTLSGTGTGMVATASQVIDTNGTASVSPTTGALVVSGGVGVGGALYIGGLLNVGGPLSVAGAIAGANTISAASSLTTPTTYGSSVAGGTLTLDSTSNATKGNVVIAPYGGNVVIAPFGGNVGINTTAPAAALDIGTASGSGLKITQAGTPGSGNAPGQIAQITKFTLSLNGCGSTVSGGGGYQGMCALSLGPISGKLPGTYSLTTLNCADGSTVSGAATFLSGQSPVLMQISSQSAIAASYSSVTCIATSYY